MAITYEPLEYGPFRSQFDALESDVQIEMSKTILNLKIDPYCKNCKPLKGPLKGIRRIHVGPNYCVAYIICEECKDNSFETKFTCLDCHKRHWYHIKLISCGPRDGFYINLEKNWQTWVQTINWNDFTQEQE